MDIEKICRGIPKIETHCHLYGTVRRETFVDLNNEAGNPFSEEDIAEFYTRGEKPVGVLRILRGLDKYLIQRPEHLYRLTYEHLEASHAHNVVYSEFFWNPTGTVHVSEIPYDAAQGAITEAIADAESKLGIVSRLIVCIDREAPPSQAVEMVDWMIQYRHPLVVGIGIDYNEVTGPPSHFVEAYRKAIGAGFKATAHAGEFGCPALNVATALHELKVNRIDHGYTVLDDPELTKDCVERGIVFTVVPTNSYYLRTLPKEEWAKKHPIRFMKGAGLKIFPNTDDPAYHKVDPTGAWFMMVDCFDYNVEDLREFALNAVDACFLPDEALKEKWRKEIKEYFLHI